MFSISAAEYSGDGTYAVSKGDVITADNDWKIEVKGIYLAHGLEEINFQLYSPNDTDFGLVNLEIVEGKKKVGSYTRLKLEAELLEISGDTSATGSALVTEYENARISIVSIDELLPLVVEELIFEGPDIDKELTYSDGRAVTINIGEETTLGNGYILKFENIARFGPSFSVYDEEGNLIDNFQLSKYDDEIAQDVGTFYGSYFHVTDYTSDSVDLWVVDAAPIIFGTRWNLFSIPIEDGDGYGTVIESTCNEASLWTWDALSNNYKKIGELREGVRIPAGRGIWAWTKTKRDLVSNDDCRILVSGTQSVSMAGIHLKAGWNLIGSPITSLGYREAYEETVEVPVIVEGQEIVESREETIGQTHFIPLKFDDIKGTCNIEKGPWQYSTTQILPVGTKLKGEWNQFSKPFEDLVRITKGYFVKVTEACTLSDR
ncbi:hypothetical protein KY339_04045 [Candidatus Woesearchaeota archaeon]|nr:hypothetical protein [Candidatus Woesearchaeota archaeon]